ncbi:MAG: Uma2 family endonuclease [Anaerolineae bacterium]|nr:Uma2 family endonuclease [Anaerolineae bacterium]
MTTATRPLTVDDLLRLGSDARIEVVEGEIVDHPAAGGRHAWVCGNILRALDQYVRLHKIGLVFGSGLLHLLAMDGQSVVSARVPDASYIRKADLVPDWDLDRPYPGAPTLAVEVMSPGDEFEDVVQKVGEYFEAGTSEVWVILPQPQIVYRYLRGESTVQTYRGDDSMDVSALFPDLTLALSAIFALPDLD